MSELSVKSEAAVKYRGERERGERERERGEDCSFSFSEDNTATDGSFSMDLTLAVDTESISESQSRDNLNFSLDLDKKDDFVAGKKSPRHGSAEIKIGSRVRGEEEGRETRRSSKREGDERRKKKKKKRRANIPHHGEEEKEKKKKEEGEKKRGIVVVERIVVERKVDLSRYSSEGDVKKIVIVQCCVRRRRAQNLLVCYLRMSKKRRNIAAEMLKVEKSFLADMETMLTCFLQPIAEMKNSKQEPLKELAIHFSALSADIQVIMGYERLIEERLGKRTDGKRLGDIFKDIANFLKTYTQYVTNYTKAQGILAANKKNEELQNLFASLIPAHERRGVKDFLIMPVQRIPRLKLMLEDLLKNTWEAHPDHGDLVVAASKLAEIAEYVEVSQHKAFARTKVKEISTCLQFMNPRDSFQLVSPSRMFVREATLQSLLPGTSVVLLNHHVFLFNDMILFTLERTDKLGGHSYLFKSSLGLCDIEEVKKDVSPSGRPFLLIEGQFSSLYKLLFKDDEECGFWSANIEEHRAAIHANLKNEGRVSTELTRDPRLLKAYSAVNMAPPAFQQQQQQQQGRPQPSQKKKRFFTLKRVKDDKDKKEKEKEKEGAGESRFGTLTRLKAMRRDSGSFLYGTLPKKNTSDSPSTTAATPRNLSTESAPITPSSAPAPSLPRTRSSLRRGDAERAEARLSSLFTDAIILPKDNLSSDSLPQLSSTPTRSTPSPTEQQQQKLVPPLCGGSFSKSASPKKLPIDERGSVNSSSSSGSSGGGQQRSWKTRVNRQPSDVKEIYSVVEQKYKEIEEQQQSETFRERTSLTIPAPSPRGIITHSVREGRDEEKDISRRTYSVSARAERDGSSTDRK